MGVQLADECFEELVHAGCVYDDQGPLAHPRPYGTIMPPSVYPCKYFPLLHPTKCIRFYLRGEGLGGDWYEGKADR